MKALKIAQLIEEANEIFNAISIFEVINLERAVAIEAINKTYNYPSVELVEQYLDVLDNLRVVITHS